MSAKAPHRAGAVGGRRADRVGGRERSAPSTHALTASESAWLAALPCALLLLALIVVLGPPLGRLLFAPPGDSTIFTEFVEAKITLPEPTEHARYVIALLGPLMVGGGAILLKGRELRDTTASALVMVSQAVLLLFVIVSVAAQRQHLYGPIYTGQEVSRKSIFFTVPTLVVALLIAAFAAWALQDRAMMARLAKAVRETPVKRAIAIAVAALYTLAWLLSAFNTDATINNANGSVWANIPFWTDEAFAIFNGHAPLVDFHAQYGHLWAYIAAGGMAIGGKSFGVYATIMLAGTAGALAAVFATFRRLADSSLAALALFLPFVATGFFMEVGPLDNRYGPANLFSLFPIRYGGPYVLLWLVVRRMRNPSTRLPFALFTFAGVVAINNLEFGLPAFAATFAALAWTAPSRGVAAIARLAASALAGIAGAVVLVSLLTLAVAGSLPHFGMLTTFPRIYGAEGFGMLPMPTLGFHLAMYVTLAAALVVAILRGVGDDADPAMTAALAWAGIFGLGASGYFVGRSHPHVLIDVFSVWMLALSLLLIILVRARARLPERRPAIAELLLLAGFGLAVCSLAQTPTPWSQVQRLQHTQASNVRITAAINRVVDELTERGEPVALLLPLGHRIADTLGLVDVTPYSNMDSMLTREQWQETADALQRAGGTRFIVPQHMLFQGRTDWLRQAGYAPSREAADLGIVEFVARPSG